MGYRAPGGGKTSGSGSKSTGKYSSSSTTKKTVSVSESSFGVSGAGSNAAALAKYGSPEAKTATASNVTPLTTTQKARSAAIPKTAINEATQLNVASPTANTSGGGSTYGNVILGSRYSFGQTSPTSTTSYINNLANARYATNRKVKEEEKQQQNTFLSKLGKGADFIKDTLFFSPIPSIYQGYSNVKVKLAEISNDTKQKVNAERIEKASTDAQAEKEIAEQAGISDLYDTTLLEKFGIGRSAEEKRIQDLVAQEAFYNQQAGEAQSVAEAFQKSQGATATPDFIQAAKAGIAAPNNTIRNIAIAGALAVGAVILLNKK